MDSLEERYQTGQEMRKKLAGNNPGHNSIPGTDQLAPDLRRIIDECLFGKIWTRSGLDLKERSICTISVLMANGQMLLLRRHIERGLTVGLTPAQIVEVFIQLTFYVGIPQVENALLLTRDIFEANSVEFEATTEYDTSKSVEQLHQEGMAKHEEHYQNIDAYLDDDASDAEIEIERLVNEYHWGAIYTRPHLSAKERAMCSLAALSAVGVYDRQVRRRIDGALKLGMTPSEILEVFIQVMLYGGYFSTRSAIRVARSVFAEKGLAV